MDRYFYSIEMDGDHKVVHMFGNVYYNNADETDKCFKLAEWTGFFIAVDKLKELLDDDTFFEYINEKVNYLSDLTEDEAVEACQVYFNGEPGKQLRITAVDEDTPCGDYWFEQGGKTMTIDDIVHRLNDGIDRTEEELEMCKNWLIEYQLANDMSLKELDELCFEDSNWVFDNIFG